MQARKKCRECNGSIDETHLFGSYFFYMSLGFNGKSVGQSGFWYSGRPSIHKDRLVWGNVSLPLVPEKRSVRILQLCPATIIALIRIYVPAMWARISLKWTIFLEKVYMTYGIKRNPLRLHAPVRPFLCLPGRL